MAEDPVRESLQSDRWLSRWLIGVGVVYLLLGANLASLVVAPERVYLFVPTYDAPLDSLAFAFAADGWFLAGLGHGVIGGFLLWSSRRPQANANLVPLIVSMELVGGIVDDLYLLFMRDYPIDAVYYGFIALHLVIIGTGYLVYPRGDSWQRW